MPQRLSELTDGQNLVRSVEPFMINIDGSFGEGGGQIVRSALALSAATGQAVAIQNIRAKRRKPGLQPQHLVAVRAAAKICQAELVGDEIGSTQITFYPHAVLPGDYTWDIGTAGSTSLVLQTVLLPLLIAPGPSTVTILGGTHNPLAPPFEFLNECFLPQLHRMGAQVTGELQQHGFYPRGGGKVVFHITGSWKPEDYLLMERGQLKSRTISAVVVRLPRQIALRECRTLTQLSGWSEEEVQVVEIDRGPSPGNYLVVRLGYDHITAVFTGLGERGLRAETLAEQVWSEVNAYLSHQAPVEVHLADQLLLPGAWIASRGKMCRFRTVPLSLHGITHAELIKKFLPVDVDVTTENASTAVVELRHADHA